MEEIYTNVLVLTILGGLVVIGLVLLRAFNNWWANNKYTKAVTHTVDQSTEKVVLGFLGLIPLAITIFIVIAIGTLIFAVFKWAFVFVF